MPDTGSKEKENVTKAVGNLFRDVLIDFGFVVCGLSGKFRQLLLRKLELFAACANPRAKIGVIHSIVPFLFLVYTLRQSI